MLDAQCHKHIRYSHPNFGCKGGWVAGFIHKCGVTPIFIPVQNEFELGCSCLATIPDEIFGGCLAYRGIMRLQHPDFVITLGRAKRG